eukprot:21167_1
MYKFVLYFIYNIFIFIIIFNSPIEIMKENYSNDTNQHATTHYKIIYNNNYYRHQMLHYNPQQQQVTSAIMKSRTSSSYNSMLSQHQAETSCNGRTISPSHTPTIYT